MTLLALALAWSLGVYMGVQLGLPLSVLALFLLAGLLLLPLLRSTGFSLLPAALLVVLLLGAIRVEGLKAHPRDPELVSYHGQGPVEVSGVVVSDPQRAGSATKLRLRVDSIALGDQKKRLSGILLATLRESPELVQQRESPYFRYGDQLLLAGELEEPPTLPEFDYREYLAKQGISTVMSFPEVRLLAEAKGFPPYQWLHKVRQELAQSLAKAIPEPQSALSQALLLGLRGDLPDDVTEEFRRTGTSHMLAISGLHVAVLMGIVIATSEAIWGRRRQIYLLLPLVLVWCYALLAGMPPSVVRAVIMASIYLLGRLLGRPGSILPALGLAAAIMIGLEPNTLWNVSFQLSFAAIGGIALMAVPIRNGLRYMVGGSGLGQGWPSALAALTIEAIAVTLAATLATLPLTAFHFHRISTVGVPATLLSLPALPFALVTGAISGLVGLASSTVAYPFGWIAWLWLAYITQIVHLFSLIPGASAGVGSVAPVLVAAYYAAIIILVATPSIRGVAGALKDRYVPLTPRWAPPSGPAIWWGLMFLTAVAALLWIAALSLPDGKLRVTFLDVGPGDATLIVTPAGQQVLVDGGADPLEAVRALGKRLPFWDKSLDLVVLSHPHEDHVNGLLEVLRRYKVGHILERAQQYETPSYLAWHQLIREKGIPVTQARQGQRVALAGGVSLEVLWPTERLLQGTPSDINNGSVVARLVYRDVSFLLTGDIEEEAEGRLVSQGVPLSSAVLKVAHQGSRTSTLESFLKRVSPIASVIFTQENSRFGHPHPETLEALQKYVPARNIFLTREHGSLQFITDGTRLEVEVER